MKGKMPANMDEIVVVKNFYSNAEADLAKSILDDAGIECFLSDTTVASLNLPTGGATNNIKLHVKRCDWVAACELLNLIDSNDDSTIRCPACGSYEITRKLGLKGFIKGFLGLLFATAGPPTHGKCKCKSCGTEF